MSICLTYGKAHTVLNWLIDSLGLVLNHIQNEIADGMAQQQNLGINKSSRVPFVLHPHGIAPILFDSVSPGAVFIPIMSTKWIG